MRWPLSAAAVTGDSMTPTLRAGDLLLVLRTSRIRPGDLVMAQRPDRPGLLLVKRAIARQPDGWWLEGDNPGQSDDSRLFGAVPNQFLLGRVVLRYWPLPHALRDTVPQASGSLRPGRSGEPYER